MRILQQIRRWKVLNAPVRWTLKHWSSCSARTSRALINRWPTSGVIPCTFGSYSFKLYNRCDDGAVQFFYYHLDYQEQADLTLFLELAKGSKAIIDIGANTGLFSILASRANPQANIIAVEPCSANADRLRLNISLNQVENVHVQQTALGESSGTISIAVPGDGSVSDANSVHADFSKLVYPKRKWGSETVPIETLDSLVQKLDVKADLIKCDVETYEMSVFNGASQVLSEDRPTLIFECFADVERRNYFNHVLRQYHYYLYLILEQGVVFCREGFPESAPGLNYLITPVEPVQTFIPFSEPESLRRFLLMRYSASAGQ